MTPEVQNAFNLFVVAVIGTASLAVGSIGAYLKASFERRVKKIAADEEEARKDREQKRSAELERMRQETAKAQTDAEEARAISEGIQNLTSAMLQLIQAQNNESHATRGALTNQAQSIGDMAESVDKMATALGDNNRITKTAANEASKLYNRMTTVFPNEQSIDDYFEALKTAMIAAIEKACEERKHDTSETPTITNLPPAAPTDTEGGELPLSA